MFSSKLAKVTGQHLFFSIIQKYMMNQMIAKMEKGQYPSINQIEVENLEIVVPPLEEQA